MLLRARIEHDDNLSNHRLSAMVGSQSFLITGFAVSLNALVDFHASKYEAAHRALTANEFIQGIAKSAEDIFPDPMSKQVYAAWSVDHKAVEKQVGESACKVEEFGRKIEVLAIDSPSKDISRPRATISSLLGF